MVDIACVDDEQSVLDDLSDSFARISSETSIEFKTSFFTSSDAFLSCHASFDILILDIEMGEENGLELARKIRQDNAEIIIIFVTKSVDFAVQGYSVDALDYVVKPINQARFSSLMMKAFRLCQSKANRDLFLKKDGVVCRVNTSSISHIMIEDHLLVYHTLKGEFLAWESLSTAEKSLPPNVFLRVNSNTLVNLDYVERFEKGVVYLRGQTKPIAVSLSKRRSLSRAFTK